MTGNQSGAAQSTTATSILESVQDSNLRLGTVSETPQKMDQSS